MIETLDDGRIILVKDPDIAEHWSVDYPLSMWEKDLSIRFLVCTSNTPLAKDFCRKMNQRTSANLTSEVACLMENDEKGVMHFTSIGSALAGSQFDQIIISDPTGAHGIYEDRFFEWLNSSVRCRLGPPR